MKRVGDVLSGEADVMRTLEKARVASGRQWTRDERRVIAGQIGEADMPNDDRGDAMLTEGELLRVAARAQDAYITELKRQIGGLQAGHTSCLTRIKAMLGPESPVAVAMVDRIDAETWGRG